MQWWSRAATALTKPNSSLRRIGFVTTNSITQIFSRRVIANALAAQQPISLVMAIPDHPWLRPARLNAGTRRKGAKGPAAVRIAMTVAEAGVRDGWLHTVTAEGDLDKDQPQVTVSSLAGRINPNLTVGADTSTALPLTANAGMSHDGVKLHGKGFRVSSSEARALGLGSRNGLEGYIRPYRNGRDLAQSPRGLYVIDLFGLSEAEVRIKYPEVYQHLLATVKPERDKNNRSSYRDLWWLLGEPRREWRPAAATLDRYIATVDTARYRVFQFVPAAVICDDKAVLIASDKAAHLGVLQSRIHCEWALVRGGWLGVGNDSVYSKSTCFDPYPFPILSERHSQQIANIAEELDQTRKLALGECPDLTMTGLYNLLDGQRAHSLSPAQQKDAIRGRVGIIGKLHQDLDAAVAQAYGWPADLPASEIVSRLVALNAERAAEEAKGTVQWLRPDYQIPRFSKPA